jgi:hypothetical protein
VSVPPLKEFLTAYCAIDVLDFYAARGGALCEECAHVVMCSFCSLFIVCRR